MFYLRLLVSLVETWPLLPARVQKAHVHSGHQARGHSRK